jgi:hypothetical protein
MSDMETRLREIDETFVSSMRMHHWEPKHPQGANSMSEHTYSGGLCGAPLEERLAAILGMNWGGAEDRWYDSEATTERYRRKYNGCCGLPRDMDGGRFGGQVQQILSRATGRPEDEVVVFLKQKVFWTNRILVGSPQAGMNTECQKAAAAPSAEAVRAMLAEVRPKMILCFGNGSNHQSPSELVLNGLAKINHWKQERPLEVQGRCRILLFSGIRLPWSASVDVWSFPHPSYGWCDRICGCSEAMKQLGTDIGRMIGSNTP